MIVRRDSVSTRGPFGYALPNQTCAGTLVCIRMHTEHLAGWEAPAAGKAEISSLSLSFYVRKVCM